MGHQEQKISDEPRKDLIDDINNNYLSLSRMIKNLSQ